MRILFTNISLTEGTGTETAILDLAMALRRRGHTVVCFAPNLGQLAARVRATGTPVVNTIDAIAEAPDIIHGHHSGPTMVALARFPDVPAIFVCHDWSSVHDDPPIHPRIRRYAYVRHVLRERLVSEKGIPPKQVLFLPNAVDPARLGPLRAPAERLGTAGIYAHPGAIPFVDDLAEGCRARGITFLGRLLDGVDRTQPEKTLSRCDVVFASGRMAIEALVAGCAVVNADRFGIGGLVTSARFDEFAAANFAIGSLSQLPSGRLVAETLEAYDACDAGLVARRARHDCDAGTVAARLEQVYRDVLAEAAHQPIDDGLEAVAFARYLQDHLRNGALYNGDFARQRFVPEHGGELARAIEVLSVDVRELRREIRYLARTRLSRALTDGWHAVRDLIRS
jgi:Glycosyltransferase Family 4